MTTDFPNKSQKIENLRKEILSLLPDVADLASEPVDIALKGFLYWYHTKSINEEETLKEALELLRILVDIKGKQRSTADPLNQVETIKSICRGIKTQSGKSVLKYLEDNEHLMATTEYAEILKTTPIVAPPLQNTSSKDLLKNVVDDIKTRQASTIDKYELDVSVNPTKVDITFKSGEKCSISSKAEQSMEYCVSSSISSATILTTAQREAVNELADIAVKNAGSGEEIIINSQLVDPLLNATKEAIQMAIEKYEPQFKGNPPLLIEPKGQKITRTAGKYKKPLPPLPSQNTQPPISLQYANIKNHSLKKASFSFKVDKTEKSKGEIRYTLEDADGQKVPFSEALRLMREDENFRKQLIDIFRTCDFKPFYWECPGVNQQTYSKRPFEFVLTKAGNELEKTPTPDRFSEHFSKSKENVHYFPNQGSPPDAMLISPAPTSDNNGIQNNYNSLATFSKYAPIEQQHNLWKNVGEQAEKSIEKNKNGLWLSTEGSGVSWLHIRLDERPKYYHHKSYEEIQSPLPFLTKPT